MKKKIPDKAWKVIQDKKHHTKGAFARAKNSKVCGVYDSRAVRWCAVGALYLVYPTQQEVQLKKVDFRRLSKMNDNQPHEEVVKFLKDQDL